MYPAHTGHVVTVGAPQVQPKTWVFHEPMVVMPVGNVVQAAVAMGPSASPQRTVSSSPAFTEQDAKRTAKQIMRGLEHRHAASPDDARREAQRIFENMQGGEGDYLVDLHVTSRSVTCTRPAESPQASQPGSRPRIRDAHTHDPSLEAEVASLRHQLAAAGLRKDVELAEARQELTNATALLRQMGQQNMELQAQLAQQQPPQQQQQQQRQPNPKRASTTMRDVYDTSPAPTFMYRSPAPPEAAAPPPAYGGYPVGSQAHPPPRPYYSGASSAQREYPSQPQVSREPDVAVSRRSSYFTDRAPSVASDCGATANRMGRGNTAIAVDNDEVELSSMGGHSARSIRSIVQEVVLGGVADDQMSVQSSVRSVRSTRSVKSAKSNASAARARMGRQNTAIACENDEVDISFDGESQQASHSPRSTQPPPSPQGGTQPQSQPQPASSPSASQARMGKQNTAIACDNDEVSISLDGDDARSIASSTKGGTVKQDQQPDQQQLQQPQQQQPPPQQDQQQPASQHSPTSQASDGGAAKARMGKQNTAIACDNDVANIDDL